MHRRDLFKTLAVAPLMWASRAQGGLARYQAKYQATWDSIDTRAIPQWYSDAKFGIFIHWGVYSVPAFAPVHTPNETPYAEWYWHSLEQGKLGKAGTEFADKGTATWEFHKRVYGAGFPYQNFAPMFRAELFDPAKWAGLFADSGAKYVALTSKHHEGFTLWKSEQANRSWGRPWNSVDIGPKRDLLTELSEAGRAKGLHMGIYYSLYEWYNPLWLKDRKRYATEHMMPQFKDVVNRAKPAIIFTDGEWELPSGDWHAPELLAWLFNESPVGKEVVVNDRWGKDTRHKHGGYYTTEYTAGMQQSKHYWEENRGMGYSYGYNRVETLNDYRTERELILMLCDIVSRGGNLLLDIGPRADGQIPVIMEERLRQMGDWLKANGEAIYGTQPSSQTRQWSAGTVPTMEEKEFMGEYNILNMVDTPTPGNARIQAFFTEKGDVTYALLPYWPEQAVSLTGFNAGPQAKVTLLETGDDLPMAANGSRLQITVAPYLRQKVKSRPIYGLRMDHVKAI